MPRTIPDCPVFPVVTILGVQITVTPGTSRDMIARQVCDALGGPFGPRPEYPADWHAPHVPCPVKTVVYPANGDEEYARWYGDPYSGSSGGRYAPMTTATDEAVVAYAAGLEGDERRDYLAYATWTKESEALCVLRAEVERLAGRYAQAVADVRRAAVAAAISEAGW